MKKSYLIGIAIVFLIATATILYAMRPKLNGDTQAQTAANANNTSSAVASQTAYSASATKITPVNTASTPTTNDSKTDFNAAVYGNEKAPASGTPATQYQNTASDLNRKPIDPQKDPANQLIDANQPKPLQTDKKPL